MLKTVRILGLLLGAVFVLSATFASMASAGETLLADWLIKAAQVPVGTEPATVTEGEFTVEDNKVPIIGKSALLCSLILDGTITSENGLAWVLKVLSLAGVEIKELEGTGMLCSAVTGCEAASESSPIEVWPLGLPWHLEAILKAGTPEDFLIIILAWGIHMLCLILATNQEDECLGENQSFLVENDAGGFILAEAGATLEPLATCSKGGANSGVNALDIMTNIKLVSGESLALSSE
jgi:hypothetical protein